MSEVDFNEDLIGLTFDYLGETWKVTGTASWNPAYVEVESESGKRSVRAAGQARVSFA